ncbi:MAG TPA: hypothetical protein PLC17_02315 [Tenuifilaceae bacterium]|nr:hypothetical protein [Tenuifilaceae bacterium]HQB78377.1 hypothetical protein [Tenuifilaceae bacterium]
MNKETIEDALLSALNLLNSEVDVIDYQELRTEFLTVIEKIENALIEINKNG